ncbi:hypothetical protein CHU98_g900 [Xylaria longipes]|nr:hypothetical protein CHU98_g900 [Xylaria longipes]
MAVSEVIEVEVALAAVELPEAALVVVAEEASPVVLEPGSWWNRIVTLVSSYLEARKIVSTFDPKSPLRQAEVEGKPDNELPTSHTAANDQTLFGFFRKFALTLGLPDLLTRSVAPGVEVVSTPNPEYGEKRIIIDEATKDAEGASVTTKVEYRIWNPFRSKLAAAVIGGIDNIFIAPGKKVLYLGAASGTSVSHVADIVGPTGNVYAVEFSHRSGRDLTTMAQQRTNVIPIVEDARHPLKYRMLVPMVDAIFLDVAQPDQARIALLNASLFLKIGGGIVISIKANCIDSTAAPEVVFAAEVQKLRQGGLKPLEQLTLEPYERDHAVGFLIGKSVPISV